MEEVGVALQAAVVLAEVLAEILAEVAAEVAAEIAAEVLAEVEVGENQKGQDCLGHRCLQEGQVEDHYQVEPVVGGYLWVYGEG